MVRACGFSSHMHARHGAVSLGRLHKPRLSSPEQQLYGEGGREVEHELRGEVVAHDVADVVHQHRSAVEEAGEEANADVEQQKAVHDLPGGRREGRSGPFAAKFERLYDPRRKCGANAVSSSSGGWSRCGGAVRRWACPT